MLLSRHTFRPWHHFRISQNFIPCVWSWQAKAKVYPSCWWGEFTGVINQMMFAFYNIKSKQQPILNTDYMWLHICLEGKLRVCGLQRPYAILLPLLLSGPFDEIQFDGPNRSKKESKDRGGLSLNRMSQGKETSPWAWRSNPVYWFPVLSFNMWNAPNPIDYDKRARQRPPIL